MIFIAALGLPSCSEDDVTQSGDIDPIDTPIDYDALSNSTFEEYINFAKTPRLGFHLEKAQAYLTGWAQSHGYQPHSDEFGNVWFDVPATAGLEPAYFVVKNPRLLCTSVGPTIHDAHTIDEALYVSTLKPVLKVIMQTLKNANLLKQ